MDITTGTRDTGIYAIQTTGRQHWPEGDGTWQAPGVRIDLMDGRRRLATCKLECQPADADQAATDTAAGIEPWARTLRFLAVVADLRTQAAAVEALRLEAERGYEWGDREAPEVTDQLLNYASEEEVATAKASGHHDPLGAPLAEAVLARLRQQIDSGLRRALAHAPDPASSPIHPAWEQPSSVPSMPGESTAQLAARELLAAWASVRDLRDPLITWAVQDASLTRTEVQQITSVSRSTINRLLP